LLVFFLGLNIFMATPFTRFWHYLDGGRVLSVFQPSNTWPLTPQDGQGLNPLLRHPGMIWHPPALYVNGVPETYILDQSGQLQYVKYGPFLTADEIRSAVEQILYNLTEE
jgi:hypothetical protein